MPTISILFASALWVCARETKVNLKRNKKKNLSNRGVLSSYQLEVFSLFVILLNFQVKGLLESSFKGLEQGVCLLCLQACPRQFSTCLCFLSFHVSITNSMPENICPIFVLSLFCTLIALEILPVDSEYSITNVS